MTAMTATASPPSTLGAVTGTPRRWLRIEGLAVLDRGVGDLPRRGWPMDPPGAVAAPGVDVSMAGYLAGPRVGAVVYNLAHNQATGLLVLGAGAASGVSPLVLAGAVLVGHSGMDRLAGYGLKYPTAFGDTHLGRIGR